MNQTIYAFDRFEVDTQRRLLLREGAQVSLTSKAFELLLALIESGGREITKDELMERVWPRQMLEDANLTVTMSHLRKALGEKAGEHRLIVTIPGKGYRFVGELKTPEALIVEHHTVSQIIIERETAPDDETFLTPPTQTGTLTQGSAIALNETSLTTPNETTRRSRAKYAVIAALCLATLALAFGVYKYFARPKPAAPFEKIKLTRLTNNGKVAAVTISPDGKYIAYVLGESEGNSLWVQQVGTASNIRVLPPTGAAFWGLTFSPDGGYIYYDLFAGDKTDPELFRVPSLGGVTQRIQNVAPTFITFAPDGKRFAYPAPDSAAGFNYIMVADADGGNKHEVARKPQPSTFEVEGRVASWSPDGETIACLVNHIEADASYSSIVGINVKDGTEKSLSAQRWYEVFSIVWLKDGSGLLISARDKESAGNQIWFLPSPEGEARPLTNDLAEYDWVSATASGQSFVAVQTNTANSIFVGEAIGEAKDFREVASEVGPLSPLVWTPDGKIIFRSSADGELNLWLMEADGKGRRQLTTGAEASELGMCISPDGKQIFFASWRSGKSDVWRVDADGGNLTQLTDGEADAYPRCAPGGGWVVYQKGLFTKPTLWKVPLAGGTPVQLTNFSAKWPAISNDGRRIAYFHMADNRWRIGIISSDGGPMLQSLDVPASLLSRPIYWSKDDQALLYISTVGDVDNIWSLPLAGAPPKQLTNFQSHKLEDFSWSHDGRLLAVTRSTHLSDVVLIATSP